MSEFRNYKTKQALYIEGCRHHVLGHAAMHRGVRRHRVVKIVTWIPKLHNVILQADIIDTAGVVCLSQLLRILAKIRKETKIKIPILKTYPES